MSENRFHEENLRIVSNILRKNDFPDSFINKYIKLRRQTFLVQTGDEQEVKKFNGSNMVVLPFNSDLSYFFKNTYNNFGIRVVFTYDKDPYNCFKKNKDSTPFNFRSHFVYSVPCKCGCLYIGQTERYLKDRMKEHKRDCNLDRIKSSLVKHSHENDHLFHFENVKILETERFFNRRIFKEMFHIVKSDNNSVNKRTDTNSLNDVYRNLILNTNKI